MQVFVRFLSHKFGYVQGSTMEFKDVLGFVFQVLGGSALSLGVAWWLGRRLISHMLEKERDGRKAALDAELETHKSQLRTAGDLALERVRTLDQFARTEHEVMLNRLQDRRAAIIGSLYAKIVEASESTGDYVMNSSPDESERSLRLGQVAYDTLEAMRRYFFRKKVWLPKQSCASIEQYFGQLKRLNIGRQVFAPGRRANDNFAQIQQAEMSKMWMEIQTSLPAALESLADELRKLVEPPSRSASDQDSPP